MTPPVNPTSHQFDRGSGRDVLQNDAIGFCVVTVPAEVSNNVDVTFQLKKALNKTDDLGRRVVVTITAFEDADGTVEHDDTPIGSVLTGTLLSSPEAGVQITALTDDTGKVTVRCTDTGNDTFYLALSCGDFYVQSDVLTFTA